MEITELGSSSNPSSSHEIEQQNQGITTDEEQGGVRPSTVEQRSEDILLFFFLMFQLFASCDPGIRAINLFYLNPGTIKQKIIINGMPFYFVGCLTPILLGKLHHNGIIMNLFEMLSSLTVAIATYVVGIALSPFAVLFLPLLFVSFLFVRLLQFIMRGAAYQNLILLQFYIRLWILYLYNFSITPGIPMVLAIASHAAPKLDEMLQSYSPDFLNYWYSLGITIADMLKLGSFISMNTFRKPRVQLDSLLETPTILLEAFTDVCMGFPPMWFSLVLHNAHEHPQILGMQTYKWIQAIVLIVSIDNIITMFIHISVWLLHKYVQKFSSRRRLMYWANGMKNGINFILSSLLLLLAWVLYCRFLREGTPKAKSFWEFVFRTFLCVLICAFLWMIKTCVILSREASSIYEKFESRILQGGKQLYFLGIIGRHNHDIFNLLYHDAMSERYRIGGPMQKITFLRHRLTYPFGLFPNAYYHRETDAVDEWENDKRLSKIKNDRAKDYLLMHSNETTSILGIQQAANYFLMAKSELAVENYTSAIIQTLDSYKQDDDNRDIKRVLQRLVGEENWDDFERQLDDVGSSESSFEERVTAWIEMAHHNCLNLANTLSSAKKVTDWYNIYFSSVVIVACSLLGLYLTEHAIGIAILRFLIAFAAFSFFQNPFKTWFDGIVFSYLRHFFEVGDLCVFNEKMMEVTTVDAWTTTFKILDTGEEKIYPNTELAKIDISHKRTDFDWNDSVELDVGSLDPRIIQHLRQAIKGYLDGHKDRFTPGHNSVVVSTSGSTLIVRFRHEVNLNNSSFYNCFIIKRERKSDYILKAMGIIYRYKTKTQ